jgi:hypothetical protein
MPVIAPKPTLKLVTKETYLYCSICEEGFEVGATGSAIEAGRNRRFCPGCFSDILRVNHIKDNDFIDD